MAVKLPSDDFMFPDLVEARHINGNVRIYDVVTGEIFAGVVCAMRQGEYIVEVRVNESPRYVVHEGNWRAAHTK